MSHQQVLIKWGIAMTFVMSLLSGCGGVSPTPVIIAPTFTSVPIPHPIPPAVLPRATAVPATATTGPVKTETTTTTEGTLTLEPSPTLQDPIDRPFLMRIDRISVIVGRGILLEGRVANGTLQANGSVEILGSQNKVISPTVLAILISNTMRDQVTVGDYAGILVGGIEATNLSPGMLLAEAGEFESYEEALQQLQ
jgi:translation elongation factor EF-Tu-like GTPase